MDGQKVQLDTKKHAGRMVLVISVNQKHILKKEWKQGNTSKENFLEA